MKKVLLIGLLGMGFAASADVVILTNGDQLTGKIVEKTETDLLFKPALMGPAKISWSHVQELRSDEPIAVLKKSGKVEREVLAFNRNGIENLADGDLIRPRDLAPSDRWHLSGLVNFAVQVQEGNSSRNDVDLDGTLKARKEANRISLFGELEIDEQEGDRPNSKWLTRGKVDHFLDREWYALGLVTAEVDEFAGLELRGTTGLGVGYQPFDRKRFSLLAEVTGLRVIEEFEGDVNKEFWGAGWSLDMDKKLYRQWLSYYLRTDGFWNVEDLDKVFVNLWTGFRVPLTAGLLGVLEFRVQHDTEPAEGAEETDLTYRLKLGYQW